MSPESISKIWSIYDVVSMESSRFSIYSKGLNINDLEKKRIQSIVSKLEEAANLCRDVATKAAEESNGIDKCSCPLCRKRKLRTKATEESNGIDKREKK